jgi:hypothetical protein
MARYSVRPRSWAVAALVLAAALLGAGITWASIPGPDGVIHGCYKNSNPAQGALITIDSAASCPSGYTALNWNQTGPQGPTGSGGPAGVSGYELVSASVDLAASPNGDTQASTHADCPAGKTAIAGGATVRNSQGDPGFTLSERIQIDLPHLTGDVATGWEVEIAYSTANNTSPFGVLIVYATCASVS